MAILIFKMKRKHLSPSFRVVLVTFHVQFFLIIFYVSSSMVAESDLFLLRQLVSSPRAQKVKINLSSIVLEQVQGLSSRRSESICYSISPFFARADQISNHLPGTPSSIPNIDGCVTSVTMTVGFLLCFPGGKSRPGIEADAWTSIFVIDAKNKLFGCRNILLLRVFIAGYGWLLPSERCLVSGRVGG
jgi:hypothetical protein